MEFFPNRLDRAASDALAGRIEAKIAERGWGLWAAEIRATGEFIGFIGLQPTSAELPCSPCIEVGWRLAQPYWGKGFATEGARAALRFGFEKRGLDEIVSLTVPANRLSRTSGDSARQPAAFALPLSTEQKQMGRNALCAFIMRTLCRFTSNF